MSRFSIPNREEVSENNQVIFDQLQSKLGFVPNLYAYYAKNETALADYLVLQNRKSALSQKEREVINLVVSQVNQCKYCLAAHTMISKMQGFNEDQILEIRKGNAGFNPKFHALAQLSQAIALHKGKVPQDLLENFFQVGYDEAQLIDVVLVIGDKIMSNYLHNLTQFEVDFPLAPSI